MILAGDIGGTKTNLAYFSEERGTVVPVMVKSYLSQQFQSLHEVIYAMQREHPAEITAAAFGVAGAIVNGRSKLTNLGWDVAAQDIRDQLRIGDVGLLNDLEATAYGTLHLPVSDRLTLQDGTARDHAAIAVIAAGTGLGEGALLWDGRRYRAMPSEGGHADFAPRNDLEIDLLRFLMKRYERVSYERVVSGPGIYTVYEFLRNRSRRPEPEWLKEKLATSDPSATVSHAALDHADDVCVQALELFLSIYGAEAGNLALKVLATGGVFIGGGIAPKVLPALRDGHFLHAFVDKGRYVNLLGSVPVYVILNDRIALYGAAHYATVMHDH